MRAPGFWTRTPPSPLARLLRPLGALYSAATARRMRREGVSADVPILCVGNFTAGGAGKTPTAIALAEMLIDAGERPAFLSRGYGGRLAGPVRVEIDHAASDVGDEPLLLAGMAPTIVSRDRPAGAKLAVETGANLVIMDDGLQNPSLKKDFAIAVVDGASGIGNALALPAGPLRASLDTQLPYVDAVLVIGEGEAGEDVAAAAQRQGKPVFLGRLEPSPEIVESLRGKPLLAFAGIGRPEKFFATLEAHGLQVAHAIPYPDHHAFNTRDVKELRSEAERRGLQPVTTEKDLARIAGATDLPPWPALMALPVRLRLDDMAGLRRLALERINAKRLR
ncbi:tetraacyldisaccharide 4'-kinase [Microvirga puerhi]|uniref:Tetraacyldisaccharide 4'-kinase n=1 Tax=Microvirga puerhi TaxID=2876078 RepID=A0ABS7VKM4_9HYPH|nr:tetraacyldisaccharide 4'-kinase [Microvirga puerhi]MBZ6076084.1 tetraacyldisaccharide 4'-kinase [Microvirga puerhi]